MNAFLFNFLLIKNPEKNDGGFQKLFSRNNHNKNWAPNQQIKMISEGTCDAEDRNVMTAKNSACHHRHKLHLKVFQLEIVILNGNNIHIICFTVFL